MREAPLVNPRVYWSGRYEHYSSLIRHEIVRERERERQRERQRDREIQRERDTETERQRETERDRDRETERERTKNQYLSNENFMLQQSFSFCFTQQNSFEQ